LENLSSWSRKVQMIFHSISDTLEQLSITSPHGGGENSSPL